MNRVPARRKVGMKEKKSRRNERTARASVDEESAHLDTFVITTVCFLRVQIYKTDLRKRERKKKKCKKEGIGVKV